MEISDVLARLVEVQKGLVIADPTPMKVEAAYAYLPKSRGELPPGVVFLNEWELVSADLHVGMADESYTVHMICLVSGADEQRNAEIATMFFEAFKTALYADVQITGDTDTPTVTSITLRGGSPTQGQAERANHPFQGLDLFLDFSIISSQTFS